MTSENDKLHDEDGNEIEIEEDCVLTFKGISSLEFPLIYAPMLPNVIMSQLASVQPMPDIYYRPAEMVEIPTDEKLFDEDGEEVEIEGEYKSSKAFYMDYKYNDHDVQFSDVIRKKMEEKMRDHMIKNYQINQVPTFSINLNTNLIQASITP